MDTTSLARTLLEPIPANRTLGIQVLDAGDASATVALVTPQSMTNVIGSLHSSGLIALIDATGLAAIIGACDAETDLERVIPLGATASLELRAPARGRLVAACRLDQDARDAVRPVPQGQQNRARVITNVEVVDEAGAVVCVGTFQWSVRRMPTDT